MTSNISKLFCMGTLCCAMALSSACTTRSERSYVAEESRVAAAKFSVEKEYVVAQMPLKHDTHETFDALTEIYKKSGHGPLYIATAHDSSTSQTSEQQSAQNANRIAKHFQNRDIDNILVSNARIENAAPDLMVVGFQTVKIKSSDTCKNQTMPGYYNTTQSMQGEYELGCQSAHLMLKQLADQRDLIGNAGLGSKNDGRRATNIIENNYRPGETQEYLPGFIVSELGGSGE